LPKSWEPHHTDEVRKVALLSSSTEYQKVIDLFDNNCNSVKVEKIERIQNPGLYKIYVCKRESMGADANERQLFHGTAEQNISSINTNNFNRRFSGINGEKPAFFYTQACSDPRLVNK
jgi:RNA processing factor Prp31